MNKDLISDLKAHGIEPVKCIFSKIVEGVEISVEAEVYLKDVDGNYWGTVNPALEHLRKAAQIMIDDPGYKGLTKPGSMMDETIKRRSKRKL